MIAVNFHDYPLQLFENGKILPTKLQLLTYFGW